MWKKQGLRELILQDLFKISTLHDASDPLDQNSKWSCNIVILNNFTNPVWWSERKFFSDQD